MGRHREKKEILELRGSWLAKNRGDQPKPPEGSPDMPSDFSDDEIVTWNRLCETLESMGTLHASDWGMLERYTRSFCRWRMCERIIREQGLTVTTEGGRNGKQVRTRPEALECHKLAAELLQIETHLGLSPSSRNRLSIHPGPSAGIPNRKSISDFRIG